MELILFILYVIFRPFVAHLQLTQKYYALHFWPTWIQQQNLQIIDGTFPVPEMLVLTTEASGISQLHW